jgi:membrane protease YdiL (CAAX protease family)
MIAFALCLVAPVVVLVPIALGKIAQSGGGRNPDEVVQELTRFVANPWMFMALGAVGQAVILLSALVPGWLSPEPLARRLALARPRMPSWGYPVVALGSLVPLAIGLSLAIALAQVIPPDPSVALLYEQMTWQAAIPFVLFISLAPGIGEELLFRGYMQKRLLERWSPTAAILVTSLLFGLMHVTPHSVANAFVIGLFLGVLAWRTGSVWPGVVCHAFINGSWNVWNIGARLDAWQQIPPLPLAVAGGAVVMVCFGVSVWLMVNASSRNARVMGTAEEPLD